MIHSCAHTSKQADVSQQMLLPDTSESHIDFTSLWSDDTNPNHSMYDIFTVPTFGQICMVNVG